MNIRKGNFTFKRRAAQLLEQFLSNKKARVKIQNHMSECLTISQGFPQGSVLSPTLFSVYINDVQTILPKGVNASLYADGLPLWTTEEYIGTVNYRLQRTLENFTDWIKDWIMKANPKKTTYTVLILSTKEQNVTRSLHGQQIK
ncbi:RNA-directed DNA polymerase from mobile element jockey [Elysia marginata]|uniref:RNA-directed DNA polymerase from mobile element jockey n=1 Tax=Elysia marginata TaxID=1093978 RepID=A0AAV4GDR4_9GAST|nr:RNA-directed DNA polymerase from mobile element jockey [Elysia marginata]